jgi:hypothetical protein
LSWAWARPNSEAMQVARAALSRVRFMNVSFFEGGCE